MVVCLASNSTIKLLCFASRCGTNTKAIPHSLGIAAKKCFKASNPPADATIPTMGKLPSDGRSDSN
ncbi:MAG: hypothetical protein ACK53Y_12260, partial [bacterium]